MPSRMERYYKSEVPKQRSNINRHLYDTLYEDRSYSNIEGIATIEKPNEVDIDQVKKLIRPEEPKPRRSFRNSFDSDHKVSIEKEYNTSNYDIKDVLNKAKSERTREEIDHHNLRNTQYDILKNLDLNNSEEKSELQELFNTIVDNSKLNQLKDKEVDLNVLEELKSNNPNVDDSASIKQEIEEKKESVPEKEPEIDKSFFTSTYDFGKDDFEDDTNKPQKESKLLKFFLFIMLVIVLTDLMLAIYEFCMKK